MNTSIEFPVTYRTQAYNCRIGKVSASSTMSPQAAAERLGEKWFGVAFQGVERVHGSVETNNDSVWRALGDPLEYACVHPNGEIEFIAAGAVAPSDCIVIARGPARALRLVVATYAERLPDGRLAVPGHKDGQFDRDRMVTVALWVNKLAIDNGSVTRLAVVFLRPWAQQEQPA